MNVKSINELFERPLNVINMGLESFADNLSREGVSVTQVAWRPPAGGNKETALLLDRLAEGSKVDTAAANEEAASRILKGKPTLVDIGIAGEVIPVVRFGSDA